MARFISSVISTDSLRASRVCVFNAPGANTWTVPAGVTCATFELWGSGGGGGARCCCDCYHQGSGGGGGRYIGASTAVTPGTVYTLYVGCATDHNGNGTHWCCLGPAGEATYLSGTGITTLCAGAGRSGNNDCYVACQCSQCCTGCVPMAECFLSSIAQNYFPVISYTCSWSYCNIVQGGSGSNKAAQAFVGPSTGSSAYYHAAGNGPTSWRNTKILTINNCQVYYPSRTEPQGWAGMGGDGAFAGECCCCIQGGSGRHGLILIRF